MNTILDPETILGLAYDPTASYRFVNLRRRPMPEGWVSTDTQVGELTLITYLSPSTGAPHEPQ